MTFPCSLSRTVGPLGFDKSLVSSECNLMYVLCLSCPLKETVHISHFNHYSLEVRVVLNGHLAVLSSYT